MTLHLTSISVTIETKSTRVFSPTVKLKDYRLRVNHVLGSNLGVPPLVAESITEMISVSMANGIPAQHTNTGGRLVTLHAKRKTDPTIQRLISAYVISYM